MNATAIAQDVGTIKVTDIQREEVSADHVDLHVSIKGSSLVAGDAALRKAKEVSQMVADLKAGGVDEKDIYLQGVQADVASGLITRSSAAIYSLRIRCHDLEMLSALLGVITGQKNATLSSLVWGYHAEAEVRDRLLDACVQQAGEKARRIASGLGVRLLGIQSFSEADLEPDRRSPGIEDLAAYGERYRGAPSGLPISHMKSVLVRIAVEYTVTAFAAGE